MPGAYSKKLKPQDPQGGHDGHRPAGVHRPHLDNIERARGTTQKTRRLLADSKRLIEQARALMDAAQD